VITSLENFSRNVCIRILSPHLTQTFRPF
jgi:hypothetical protein